MKLRIRSVFFRYMTGVAVVALVLGLKLLLIRVVTQDAPFLLFSVAVMVAALLGGLGPGLLATGVATLFNLYFFMQPFGKFAVADPGAGPRLAIFVIEGICISLICAKLQAARRRIEEGVRESRELQRRIIEIGDAEQRRIGHDLHDGLGQHLTGIALMTQQLGHRLDAEGSPHAPKAAKISALAERAVEWTHDLSRSLSPAALETRGLAEALQELAANVESIFGIECSVELEGDVLFRDVAPAVHLYRIAQEAISNAVKHGQAKHVKILLSSEQGEICMRINDDGQGIQPSTAPADGMGLRIMQYRARMIGAQLEIAPLLGPYPARGTIITCRYRQKIQE